MTVTLISEATREDFYAVKDAARDDCKCDLRVKLVAVEVSDERLCVPCRAKKVLNALAMLSGEL